MARPQRVHSRWRARVPYLLHQRPRRRGDGHHLELPRHDGAWASGDVGGLAGGLPPDPTVQVVELARQLRPRRSARPAGGRGVGRRRGGLWETRRLAWASLSWQMKVQAPATPRAVSTKMMLTASSMK